jgi:hypothetical protein
MYLEHKAHSTAIRCIQQGCVYILNNDKCDYCGTKRKDREPKGHFMGVSLPDILDTKLDKSTRDLLIAGTNDNIPRGFNNEGK